jgi:hypothetical protein
MMAVAIMLRHGGSRGRRCDKGGSGNQFEALHGFLLLNNGRSTVREGEMFRA